MQVGYQHGSRGNEHGWASQYWQEKEQQRSCVWVQPASKETLTKCIQQKKAETVKSSLWTRL